MNLMTSLHHITACSGKAQDDVDFFVKALGQRLVKKTLLYDGNVPFYHLYFSADALGTPGGVMTTFPMGHSGRKGRQGTGQFGAVSYSVPENSLEWWIEHLKNRDILSSDIKRRFGERYIEVSHPAGLVFELIENKDDKRPVWDSPHVLNEKAIRGFHSTTVSVRDTEWQDRFMIDAWGFKCLGQDGEYTRYALREGRASQIVDVRHQPYISQGSWLFAPGTVHHAAFAVKSKLEQKVVKDHLEGIGYTDTSESKHRGYFESIYVRSPGGALFEAATCDIGFLVDEQPEQLGLDLKVSPQFVDQKDELASRLDPISI